MSAGVLCKEEVLDLINPSSGKAVIDPTSSSELKVAASSLDLPIGMQYWEMAGSCRTGKTLNVRDIIKRYGKPCLLDQQKVLKKNQVYLFEVGCSLDLSAPHARGIEGKATGRSSIGRLDVLARLLIDEGTRFDRVPRNYNKKLYVEVTPFTFDLLVRPGTRLSQLRLFRGYEQLVTLTKEELSHEDDVAFPVVDGSGSPLRQECDMDPHDSWYPLCVDITPDPKIGCVAFVAKDNVSEAVDPDAKEAYDPRDFWEAVYPDESEAKTIQPGQTLYPEVKRTSSDSATSCLGVPSLHRKYGRVADRIRWICPSLVRMPAR